VRPKFLNHRERAGSIERDTDLVPLCGQDFCEDFRSVNVVVDD